jgi:hypothetical protein
MATKGCSVWNTLLCLGLVPSKEPLTAEPDAGNPPRPVGREGWRASAMPTPISLRSRGVAGPASAALMEIDFANRLQFWQEEGSEMNANSLSASARC